VDQDRRHVVAPPDVARDQFDQFPEHARCEREHDGQHGEPPNEASRPATLGQRRSGRRRRVPRRRHRDAWVSESHHPTASYGPSIPNEGSARPRRSTAEGTGSMARPERRRDEFQGHGNDRGQARETAAFTAAAKSVGGAIPAGRTIPAWSTMVAAVTSCAIGSCSPGGGRQVFVSVRRYCVDLLAFDPTMAAEPELRRSVAWPPVSQPEPRQRFGGVVSWSIQPKRFSQNSSSGCFWCDRTSSRHESGAPGRHGPL